MPRLKDKYLAEVVPALRQKFGYKNINEVPKLTKVVINMGLGDCKDNAKALGAGRLRARVRSRARSPW